MERFCNSPSGHFDIILMDIRMPNMNGLEAAAKIREVDREDAKKVPIIAMTANAFDEDVQMSLRAGMNDHLAKPIEVEKMFDAIERWLLEKGK